MRASAKESAPDPRAVLFAALVGRVVREAILTSRAVQTAHAQLEEFGFTVNYRCGVDLLSPADRHEPKPRARRRPLSSKLTRADRRLAKKWGIKL